MIPAGENKHLVKRRCCVRVLGLWRLNTLDPEPEILTALCSEALAVDNAGTDLFIFLLARMEPPIQTDYLRSGGAMICTGGRQQVTFFF